MEKDLDHESKHSGHIHKNILEHDIVRFLHLVFFQHFTEIRYLTLSRCRNVTDEALKAVAASCPSLASLDVSRWLKHTDEALKAVAATCPSLASPDVSGATCAEYRYGPAATTMIPTPTTTTNTATTPSDSDEPCWKRILAVSCTCLNS